MILALAHRTGLRLVEIAGLLIFIAGVWLVASELPQMRWHRFRIVVAGLVLAAAGVLLVVAVRWGGVG